MFNQDVEGCGYLMYKLALQLWDYFVSMYNVVVLTIVAVEIGAFTCKEEVLEYGCILCQEHNVICSRILVHFLARTNEYWNEIEIWLLEIFSCEGRNEDVL